MLGVQILCQPKGVLQRGRLFRGKHRQQLELVPLG